MTMGRQVGDQARPRKQPARATVAARADGVGDERSAVEQILAQQAAVAAIGQRALGEPDLDRLFAEASKLVADVLATELVSIMELAPDGGSLKLVAGCGWDDGLVGQVVLGTQTGSMTGYTLATGEPVIVEDLAEEKRFSVSDVLRSHNAVSGLSVRIGEPERPYGALAAFTSKRGHYTADDSNFLQAVANVLAAAVVRVRVERELRRSRDELATIVSSVSDGITVQGRDGRLAFANDAAARLTGYSHAAEMVAAPLSELIGRFEILDENGDPMPLDRLPGRRALLGQRVPATLVRFRIRATGDERWSLVEASPVRGEDGSVAQVINVFRDITEQKRADDLRRFVTDALAAMTATLDPAEGARRLAEACVPRLADYCVVDLIDANDTVHTAAIIHSDPQRAALAVRQRRLRPVGIGDPTGIGRVLREGTPERGEVTEEVIRRAEPSEEERDLLLALELRSYFIVPLMGRGRPIGAMTLVMAESRRTFTAADLALAEELGARAGIALENARLYETVDDRRAELDAVLTAMAEAVLVFDGRGQLRLTNRAAERLFGRRPPATVDELARQLHTEDGGMAPASDAIGEGGIEVQLPGTGRWLEMRRYRATRHGDDKTDGGSPSVVVLRDVTDARAARAARDAFMGLLSHELRTPITTIYGGSQLLERDLDEDRRRDVVRDIRSESERLARLIEDLLVMTRVERGGLDIGDEPVLVQRLVPALAEALVARIPGLQLDVRLAEGLPAVRGDATYLEQVLRNLLTNAVRYGNALERGVLVVADEGDDEVIVRVLDEGPGLDADDPERLFDLFYRAPTARGVPGGAGIGLFVCRHLIEAMGGRIWASSRAEGGSEFGFALPIIDADVG